MLLQHIPNTLTLCNLSSGIVGCRLLLDNKLEEASYILLIGLLFDFLDGFSARLLRVSSELGKQLDSLADLITCAVLPTFILYKVFFEYLHIPEIWQFTLLFIPAGAAIRLAKFNLDTRQSEHFIGLPTPANALLITGLAMSIFFAPDSDSSNWISDFWLYAIYLITTLLFPLLMNSPIIFLSLKFKKIYSNSGILMTIILLISLIVYGLYGFFAAILIGILIYVLTCVFRPLFIPFKKL